MVLALFHGEYEWQDPKSDDEMYAKFYVKQQLLSAISAMFAIKLYSCIKILSSRLKSHRKLKIITLYNELKMCNNFSVRVTYIDKDGKRTEVKGKVGDNVLYLAHRYGIEMEGF